MTRLRHRKALRRYTRLPREAGADKSGLEQGAGNAPVAERSGCLSEANPEGRKGPRVEGLLAVSIDGVFYIPCYDHNGNIILYVSESGSIAAQYTYDPYGNVIDTCGSLADVFYFGFSTQYHDRETGMVGYKRRFYRPDLGRWLNRDPIEEEGGKNVYCFVENSPSWLVDFGGLHIFQFNDKGWSSGNVSQNNGGVLGVTSFSIRSGSECKFVSGKYSTEYTFVLDIYSMVQDADDSKWDDDEYGDTIRDPRVKSKWNSFWFFESRRRRNLVIEHEERHRQHARKNYDAVIGALGVIEQYSSKSACEANAREKIAAAVKLFNLMDSADAEKVERGEL